MAYIAPYLETLQPASWRGIIFQVDGSTYQTGRRIAVHEYPYRDTVWVEDLGLARQQITFSAFLIGDDVFDQEQALVGACNQAGVGSLVHPSLGSQTANLISASFGESKSNMVEVRLTFVLSQQPTLQNLYPSTDVDTQSASDDAADDLDDAAASDFEDDIAIPILSGPAVVAGIVNSVTQFSAVVITASQDAARAISALAGLGTIIPAIYTLSRFADGNVIGTPSSLAGISSAQSVYAIVSLGTEAMLTAMTSAQAVVQTTISTAETDAEDAPSTNLATDVQTMTENLRAVMNDPADQIRLLSSLASFTLPALPPGTSTINAGIQTVTASTTALCRRAVLSSLARACANYNPTSTNDVAEILQAIVPLYDAEIMLAADASDLQSFTALRVLRASVVNDLQTRGSNLPSLIEVTNNIALPSVVVAYSLYGDATKADQLLKMNPTTINPLFMPTNLVALSQ